MGNKKQIKLLRSAQKYLRLNKLDKAVKEFNNILSLEPNDIDARKNLGDISLKKNDKKTAITHFERIAEIYNQDGFHIKAMAMLKRIIKIDVDNEKASMKLAQLCMDQGLFADAKSIYLDAAKRCEINNDQDKAVDMYKKIQGFEKDNPKISKLLEKFSINTDIKTENSRNEIKKEQEEEFIIENDGKEIIIGGNDKINETNIKDNQMEKQIIEPGINVQEYNSIDEESDETSDLSDLPGIIETPPETDTIAKDDPFYEKLSYFDLKLIAIQENKAIMTWIKELDRQYTSTIERNMKEIFNAFTDGVNNKIDQEDHATRYSLGIAYMEMRLYDEAINEFLISSQDQKRAGDIANLIGICFRNKGMYDESTVWFSKSLKTSENENKGLIPVKYELVLNYLKTNDQINLIKLTREIMDSDPDFRDIKKIHKSIENL